MRTYETVFILKPGLEASEYEKHINFYKENITSFDGEILKTDIWGKQNLAYNIQGFNEGYYVLIQFKAFGTYPNAELEKRFQFNEDVIRYVIVMLDEKRFKLNPKKDPTPRKQRSIQESFSEDVAENANEEQASEGQEEE